LNFFLKIGGCVINKDYKRGGFAKQKCRRPQLDQEEKKKAYRYFYSVHSQPMAVSPGSCSNAQAFCLLDVLGSHCSANLEDRDRLGLGVGRQPPNTCRPSDVHFGRCRWAASGRPLGYGLILRTRTRGKWRGLAFTSSAFCRAHRSLHHTRVFCRLFQTLA
jgi:hypothetical protein